MIVDVVVPFYGESKVIGAVLESVLRQRLPEGWRLHVIAVDDGTPDGGDFSDRLRTNHREVTVIRLAENQGRSLARNEGVAAGTGSIVVLLDSDCTLDGDDVLTRHLSVLDGCDVSIGTTLSLAPGVWGEIGNRAASRRTASGKSGDYAQLTTAHVAMTRSVFEAVGGFSEDYRQYGFEDRDLLARIVSAGYRLTHSADLIALESDAPTVAGYTHKARMAGRHTAATFRRDHPALYADTPYCRLDVGLHSWLRPVAALTKAVLPALVQIGERAIEWTFVPMGMRVAIVRSLFAASFLVGSADAIRGS